MIGHIVDPAPERIHLTAEDERYFQQIRKDSRGGEDELAIDRLILDRWGRPPRGFSFAGYSDEERTEGKTRYVLNPTINSTPRQRSPEPVVSQSNPNQQSNPKISTRLGDHMHTLSIPKVGKPTNATIEEMILSRSRATAFWSSDISRPTSFVVDESSVLEGRSLSNYRRAKSNIASSSNTVSDTAVALLPSTTETGDVIIALKGSRLPFIVRKSSLELEVVHEIDPGLPFIMCELVGECFMNNYKDLDSVFVPSIAENGEEDHEFVFVDVESNGMQAPHIES